jgi:rSAM-partnered protein
MSERVDRRTTDAPRASTEREWEIFLRERTDDPITHAGSVSAPTVEIAREQVTQLLGWSATDVWLCPADELERFEPHDDLRQ